MSHRSCLSLLDIGYCCFFMLLGCGCYLRNSARIHTLLVVSQMQCSPVEMDAIGFTKILKQGQSKKNIYISLNGLADCLSS